MLVRVVAQFSDLVQRVVIGQHLVRAIEIIARNLAGDAAQKLDLADEVDVVRIVKVLVRPHLQGVVRCSIGVSLVGRISKGIAFVIREPRLAVGKCPGTKARHIDCSFLVG